MKNKIILIFFLLSIMSTIVLAKPQNKTLQTIRETYEKITTIEADFSQSVTFDGFDTTANSNGKVYFKKGKMRWDYSAPTRQQIFVDGETLFHYTPENKQVLKSLLKKNTGLPLDLFFNIEKLEALFHITPLEKTVLLLKPKEKGSHIQQMRITLAPLPKLGGLFIKEIVLHEENGNQSQFQFKNYRINKTLSEEVLSFKIPEGVELIELHP